MNGAGDDLKRGLTTDDGEEQTEDKVAAINESITEEKEEEDLDHEEEIVE